MEKFSTRKPVSHAINLVLKVEGFEVRNGIEYVQGRSIESGEKVEACLKPATDGMNRRSLLDLSKGFKFGKDKYQLQPGGIICIDMAHKQSDGTYMGRWPTVLAYSEADQANVRHGLFSFCAFQAEKTGTRISYAIQHASNPQNFIRAEQPEGLKDGVKQFAGSHHIPVFTIRGVKPGTQEVICWHAVLNNYNKATRAPFTPDEMSEEVVKWARDMRQAHPDIHFDVVPGIRYNLSRELVKNDKAFELLCKIASFFRVKEGEDQGEYVAKKAVIKVGGEHGQFCNEFRVIDAYEPGIMPACISSVVPAHDQRTEQADLASHEPEHEVEEVQELQEQGIELEAALAGLQDEEDGPSL